ncbi:MAG: bifunctional cytidylyltransferase/SDR family oxidoreductase [Epsilonproteobacteria bacterium]|nr:bifunctional cytidylyltransferase/SDR family oxidoreductase [Campylobacterota bacterium]
MKNIAIVLAGGSGSRFGLNIPKQFAKVAGKTLIEHTLDTFQNSDLIDEICVVIKADWIDKIEEIIIKGEYSKVKKVLNGGEERKDSSLSAINAYKLEENANAYNMIFHDAVRPFVTDGIIQKCIDGLSHYSAIDVAIPATDTIIEVKNSVITNIPNRSDMMQGQTPQCFKLETINRAYEIAQKDSELKATDDCGVVKKYLPDEEIYVVEGSVENIKITYEQDIFMADKIFQLRKQTLNYKHTDEYYQEKLRDKVLVVFGGSYGIGKDIGELAQKYGSKVYFYSRSVTDTDVSRVSDVKRGLELAHGESGKIDFVVNTASILIKEPLAHTAYSSVLDIVNINYLGAVNVAKESISYLEESRGGLLNFTSSSYTRGRQNYSLYSSTKSAMVNLTQALGEELSFKGVRVNCINPERTQTPMRIANFGNEPANTLLSSMEVAYSSINTLLADFTGQVVDVRLQKTNIS